ncbi:hypothetical protein EJ110_NYTH25915 [Nymphaea thermarum]|nr:hypothetical protein EJ110_NYTH25915 [Nymphaea thermarum]
MDIFHSTYENGVCVKREWLVCGAKWDQYPEWISIKVGSDSHRDVVIPHPSVEGWHCELEMDRETHRMWIVNMAETDKVIVTGDKMEPYSKRRIFLGEHFQVDNLESTMALEATPWPNAIMPPETDVESDTDCSSDGNDEILSELPIERNAHFKNTKSSNGTKVFNTKKGILRTPSLSLSAKHPSTNQKGKEGVLGSASKYFPYGIPSENQPNEAEFKVTAGPLSVETQEGLLATPPPTTRIVSGKSSEEVMSEKMKLFPPPRRTGIAKVYRQFYSSKPPMMPVPRVTQFEPRGSNDPVDLLSVSPFLSTEGLSFLPVLILLSLSPPSIDELRLGTAK